MMARSVSLLIPSPPGVRSPRGTCRLAPGSGGLDPPSRPAGGGLRGPIMTPAPVQGYSSWMNSLSCFDSLELADVEKPSSVQDAGNGYIMIEAGSMPWVEFVSSLSDGWNTLN